ncbi:hypothetical protein FRB96_002785 [Tulasnella sp. 330]|nr:hypothetical protein FRB96_002785 [Tulasnella sp. 330]KAG8872633.1 hypothetical protein FRB97_007478 [Tulasnella sp. 331]
MDNSPTALFDSYEQDFKTIIDSIREKLEVEAGAQKGEQRKATLRRVEMELDEADEMVSQMEVEIQGMPQSIKSKYQIRVKSSKGELTKWKKQAVGRPSHVRPGQDILTLRCTLFRYNDTQKDLHLANSRSELLSSRSNPIASDDPYADSDDVNSQRARLLQGTQSLADSTRRLEDSQRIAIETEGVGADILRTLRQQRGTIEHAVEQLGQADTSIDRASGTLKGMVRRMYQQKYVTVGIIVVLILLILIILYEKLIA